MTRLYYGLWVLALAHFGVAALPDHAHAHNRVFSRRSLFAAAIGSTACPAATDELANVTRPVLTTSCPEECTATSLCVYFPSTHLAACDATPSQPCLRDQGQDHGTNQSEVCGFQCIPTPKPYIINLFLSLYTNATPADTVATWGTALPNVAVNTSQVGAWVGDVDRSKVLVDVSIAGYEAAANVTIDSQPNAVPRGEVVPFELPASFFANRENLITLRLKNVQYPSPPAGSNASLSFRSLQSLILRNTLLTEMPLPQAKFSVITQIDLSENRIRNLTRWGLPNTLELYNLSTNEISFIENGAFPSQLKILDLSQNPLRDVGLPNGTLPAGLKVVRLEDAMLSAVPVDVSRMEQLSGLFLHHNKIGTIADSALASTALTALGVNNCSLQEIPAAVAKLTKLTVLQMSDNDLSRSLDFSVLPVTIERLEMSNCKLQGIPLEISTLTKLSRLHLSKNPQALSNLSMLPESIQLLLLDENALDEVPVAVNKIKQLQTLSLLENPLRNMAAGSLPPSLREISFSNLSVTTVPLGTLPSSLTRLSMSECLVEEAPRDIAAMQTLLSVTITGCQLRSFVFTETLPVAQLDLANNRLTALSIQMPALVHLNVSGNALTEFTLAQAPLLETLLLTGNNLTTVPSSLVNFRKLSRLDMARNPIRNFTPSIEQLDFFSKIPVVVFDQEMFATDCAVTETIDFRGYRVCDIRLASAKRKVSAAVIGANVIVALGLALLIGFLWRRRRRQRLTQQELDSQSQSLEKQRLNQSDVSIWTNPLLLRHRVDENLVEPIGLLGSGMFGEVWLATYMDENVAVKTLKHPDRDSVEMFIDEIKLVLTLSHPRIVSSIGVLWTKESDIALITEFLPGGDLRDHLDRTAKLAPGWSPRMVEIALEITEAIVYLHSFDPVLIHRDLKSRNVLLDSDLHAKLSDFGVSRFKLDDETMTAGVGTVRWIAPEVLAGQRYDESADVYSLGVIMYEIDTHKLPFANEMDETGIEPLNDSAIAGLLISGALKCELSDSCPREIRSLADRCTAFDPQVRPAGLQVAYQLRRFLRSLRDDGAPS